VIGDLDHKQVRKLFNYNAYHSPFRCWWHYPRIIPKTNSFYKEAMIKRVKQEKEKLESTSSQPEELSIREPRIHEVIGK